MNLPLHAQVGLVEERVDRLGFVSLALHSDSPHLHVVQDSVDVHRPDCTLGCLPVPSVRGPEPLNAELGHQLDRARKCTCAGTQTLPALFTSLHA